MGIHLHILRFLLAGGLNTAVSYITFLLVYSLLGVLNVDYSVAISVIVSLLVSLAFSYQVQRRFVWRRQSIDIPTGYFKAASLEYSSHVRKRAACKRKTIYTAYYLSVASLNIESVTLLQEYFSLSPRIGQAIFTITSSFVSFFFLRWLFREIER
jgi:putative flippase GtrA